MSDAILDRTTTLAALPAPWPDDLLPTIRKQLEAAPKLVVLDDDPTGTQTVYDVPVLTTWDVDALVAALEEPEPVFYILTNSRSLPEGEAVTLAAEIGEALTAAVAQTGRRINVVSRSDSTLRGHFPAEVDALAVALDMADAPMLIIPFFLEGGRYTLDDVHYVAEDDSLIPAAQTPFAQDAAFGYQHSNLREWVAEKCASRVDSEAITPEAVASITLDDLRQGGPEAVRAKLAALRPHQICIVNAVELRDLEVLVAALLPLESAGHEFVYRTAASFVQIRAGLATRPLLTAQELSPTQAAGDDESADNVAAGGLVVVGSYVPKSTRQLEALLTLSGLTPVGLSVPDLLDETRRDEVIAAAQKAIDAALLDGSDAVLYTSRTLITGDNPAESLAIGQQVSSGLVAVVAGLMRRPRYLVAKGGITSSDVATVALEVNRAQVIGQALPGVPAWRLGDESRFPGLAYVIFPGNVGDDQALATLVKRLRP